MFLVFPGDSNMSNLLHPCIIDPMLTHGGHPRLPFALKGLTFFLDLGLLIPVPLIFLALDSSLNGLSQTPVLKVLGVTFWFLSAPGHRSQIMPLQP